MILKCDTQNSGNEKKVLPRRRERNLESAIDGQELPL